MMTTTFEPPHHFTESYFKVGKTYEAYLQSEPESDTSWTFKIISKIRRKGEVAFIAIKLLPDRFELAEGTVHVFDTRGVELNPLFSDGFYLSCRDDDLDGYVDVDLVNVYAVSPPMSKEEHIELGAKIEGLVERGKSIGWIRNYLDISTSRLQKARLYHELYSRKMEGQA